MLAAALRHGHPHAPQVCVSASEFCRLRVQPFRYRRILADVAVRWTLASLFTSRRSGRGGHLELEGSVMSGEGKSRFGRLALLGRSHLATQAAVLLPVVALAGLAAWKSFSAPTNAK